MNILNSTAQIQAQDAAHHIHPFTNTRELNEAGSRVIVSADGVHLSDSDGNRILDGMSGLWCTAIGYGRNEIVEAITRQLEQLPYYNTFFQTTHTPVVELSALLSELTPPQFNRFFYTSSGSEANDTILKIAAYYWELKGKPERNQFVSRKNAYHGSTVAAAQLGGFTGMHKQCGVPVTNIHHAPCPDWWSYGGDLSEDEFGEKVARETLEFIDKIGSEKVAAFIGEPIMGAGGAILPPLTYWPILSKGIKERGILLISDEVICGFGRTGEWFGCQTFGSDPDFMTMAKGLTSGYQPLGAVAISDEVSQTLIDHGDEFRHGYTYSAHPAACAAAIANLTLFRDEKIIENAAKEIGPYLGEKWLALADHPIVGYAQYTGMIGSLQLAPEKNPGSFFPEAASVGMIARGHCLDNGLIMRAVGDRMIIAPPLVMTRQDADELIEKASKTLDQTHAEVKKLGLL